MLFLKYFTFHELQNKKGKNLNCPSGRKARFGLGSSASSNLKFYGPVVIFFCDESVEYSSRIV
jgi:hypothetical protein